MSLVAALTLMAGAAHAEKPREQSKSKKVMVQELTLDQFQQKVYNLSDANASSSLTYLGDKPAIVDFYASWCGPCMAEIPFLKADYEKYGKKGFEIYAVSFDSQRDRWIDAVRQQGMKWIQVSDLSGFQTPAAEAYAVQSIPSNFLIRCSDGQIVATQLRGEALGEKLGELLGD